MKICLTIEKDRELWQSTLMHLHMCGFKWHRTGTPLDDFNSLNKMLAYGAKGIDINFKDKTVAWTSELFRSYDYCIEVKK